MASKSTSPLSKPHVVIMPLPLQGHIRPLLELATLLPARSFLVTFVLTKRRLTQLRTGQQGRRSIHHLADELGIRLVGIPDGLLDVDDPDSQENFLASLPRLRAPFDALVGGMVQKEGNVVACIISDSFLVWTQDVADKWHIPRVCFWPQSLTAFACSISLPKIMAAYADLDPFKEEVYRSEAARSIDCIPGLSDIDTGSLPFCSPNEKGASWLRGQLEEQIEHVDGAVCIIVNTCPDLEMEVHAHLKDLPLYKPVFALGPLLRLPNPLSDGTHDKDISFTLWDEDQECLQWLDLQQPHSVLYIALGSLAVLEEHIALEIAMGLKACQVPFLWVLRSKSCESTPLLFENSLGKIVRWAPQLRVLSHRAIGGFLTHSGWNSVLESITMGVPVIAWPYMMDQITNCWLQVKMWKVGLRLELDALSRVGRASVEKAVRTLMQEDEGCRMRMNASHFSSLVQSNLTTSTLPNLDSLMDMILSWGTKTSLDLKA